MFLTRSEYDRGVNTFSPEGRLFQVEYAMEAIKLGSIVVGIRVDDGVLLVAEKRLGSTLIEPHSVEKILEIDSHIGCAVSGLTADSKTLVNHARSEATRHTFVYDEPMPVQSVVQSVCDLSLRFGDADSEHVASRPFGVALLAGGIDENGPQLFYANPSGTFVECGAKAIGAGSEGAQSQLLEAYNKTMGLGNAEQLAISILRQSMEEKPTSTNVEMASITSEKGFRLYSEQEVANLVGDK